jgi:hypothetical protein
MGSRSRGRQSRFFQKSRPAYKSFPACATARQRGCPSNPSSMLATAVQEIKLYGGYPHCCVTHCLCHAQQRGGPSNHSSGCWCPQCRWTQRYCGCPHCCVTRCMICETRSFLLEDLIMIRSGSRRGLCGHNDNVLTIGA